MTSSPGSHSAANATKTAYFPPTVTNTWDAVHVKPLSRLVFTAIASRKAGNPAAGVYRCAFGSRAATTAASTMWSGVAKSGSPAPKPMTSSPLACNALAFASTANVADSAIAASRAETLDFLLEGVGFADIPAMLRRCRSSQLHRLQSRRIFCHPMVVLAAVRPKCAMRNLTPSTSRVAS